MPPQIRSLIPIRPDRRSFLVGAGAALLVAPAWPARADRRQDLAFDVLRGGNPIGSHRIGFRNEGEDLVVDVSIELEVTFLFVTAYRYSHRNRESWRDGRLRHIRTATDDNGRSFSLEGRGTGPGLRIKVAHDGSQGDAVGEGDAGGEDGSAAAVLPPGLLPSSFWHAELVHQDRLLNTQDGRVMQVRFEHGGRERIPGDGGTILARRYACRGDLELDLWRDEEDRLARLQFRAGLDNSVIDYRRRPPGAG